MTNVYSYTFVSGQEGEEDEKLRIRYPREHA